MKKVMLATIVVSAVILNCSKEEEIEIPVPIVKNSPQTVEYIPLAVGNYWIYDTYYIVHGGWQINHIIGSTIRNKGNDIVNLNSQGIDKVLFSSNNLGSIYRSETINAVTFQFLSTTKTTSSNASKNVSSSIFNCYEGISNLTQIIPINSNWSKS
jgi:hypothetical protein